MKTVVSVDPCKRIRVAVGTPIKLLIKRMAFPSYEAWQQGVVGSLMISTSGWERTRLRLELWRSW
jgi:hypothetical protein